MPLTTTLKTTTSKTTRRMRATRTMTRTIWKMMTIRTHWTKRASNRLTGDCQMTAPVTAAILLSLVTGVSGAQSPASAPSPESSNRAQAAELSSTDRAFITTAAEGGKAEIELGQL